MQKSQIWLLTKYVDFCCSCCRCCVSSTSINTNSSIELYESQRTLDHIPIQSHSRSPDWWKTQGGGPSNQLPFHPFRNAVRNNRSLRNDTLSDIARSDTCGVRKKKACKRKDTGNELFIQSRYHSPTLIHVTKGPWWYITFSNLGTWTLFLRHGRP